MIGAYIPSLHSVLWRPQSTDVGATTDFSNDWQFEQILEHSLCVFLSVRNKFSDYDEIWNNGGLHFKLTFILWKPQSTDVGAMTDSSSDFTWHFVLSRIFENY